jgi:hypothetical protein
MATENNHGYDGFNSIPLEKGIELAKNWRTYLSSSNSEFQTKSFWIDIRTIQAILNNSPEADGIRGYIGLEDTNDPANIKIVLVGTKDNQDIIDLPYNEDPIHDFVSTCPPVCPTGSPLNE